MTTFTQKKYLFVTPKTDTKEYPKGYSLSIENFSWSCGNESICLTPDGVEVTVDVPDFSDQELLQKAIQTLETKQKNVMAEAVERQTRLQGMIDKLILIEHKPTTA